MPRQDQSWSSSRATGWRRRSSKWPGRAENSTSRSKGYTWTMTTHQSCCGDGGSHGGKSFAERKKYMVSDSIPSQAEGVLQWRCSDLQLGWRRSGGYGREGDTGDGSEKKKSSLLDQIAQLTWWPSRKQLNQENTSSRLSVTETLDE